MIISTAEFYHNNNILDDIDCKSVPIIQRMIKNYNIPDDDTERSSPRELCQHNAYLWIKERVKLDKSLSSEDLKVIHYKLNKFLDVDYAGIFREFNKSVRGYKCPAPELIPNLMRQFDLLLALADDIIYYGDDLSNFFFWHVHNVFQCIHPFHNDNGRVGRFLFNMLRMRHGMDISTWDVNKVEYYDQIRKFEPIFEEKFKLALQK